MRETTAAVLEGDRPAYEQSPRPAWRSRMLTEVNALLRRFDRRNGGFGAAPGFPAAYELLFLLAYAREEGDETAREAALNALMELEDASFCPGRTLYDSALLSLAGMEAYAQTGDLACREMARRTLEEIQSGRLLPGGGFACGQDGAVLTGWNAAAAAALARAGRVLGGGAYRQAARNTRLFLKTRLTAADGRLWRSWRDREPAFDGQLEDYALYCWALTELYETEFAVSCLREAAHLADQMRELYWDEPSGSFYPAAGYGAAGFALGRLARLTCIPRFREMARRQLAFFAEEPETAASDRYFGLMAMAEALHPRRELICAAAGEIPDWLAGAGEAHHLTVLAKTPENSRALDIWIPRTAPYPVPEAGICCCLPAEGGVPLSVDSPEDLGRLLRQPASAPALVLQ